MADKNVLYQIEGLVCARFISRPNRYLAEVELDGERVTVHVHDPGRLKELLYPDNDCLIKYAAGPQRKTSWDMIAAKKGEEYVLVHSGYHRYLAENLLKSPKHNPFGEFVQIKPEVKYGNSRIDFHAQVAATGESIWVEVKGCSLSEDGIAKFPDAPTVRGTRHLEELIEIKEKGERSGVLILVLSEADIFEPKWDTDPKFAKTFYRALQVGVEIKPVKILLNLNGELTYEGLVLIGEEKNE